MKPLVMTSVIILVGVSGCATPARSPSNTGTETSPSAAYDSIRQVQNRERQADSASSSGVLSYPQLQPAEPDETSAAPYAVIKFDPKIGRLTSEMESKLLKVAEEVKNDDRIILRLESYVPNSGSPALSIGVANKALQLVRNRLLELGIPIRRIVQASFGQEYDGEHDLHRPWVEIYLVKKGGLS
ncbi:MAG: hypothetical protein PHQ05_02610 [Sterolibacterium sp.]|nr:hypothetical protein [Sterolibacterium sp.]